jgi:putative transposase
MPSTLEQPEDLGLWRFSIISPLLHRSSEGPPLRERIDLMARQLYYTPAGSQKQLCPDTIRHWLCCYRSRGLDGLRNKVRKDRGVSLVPAALGEALADLRTVQPHWTFRRLLNNLRQQGLWDGIRPSRSALYRYGATHQLTRSAAAPPEPVRCFEYPHFGDLWSADFLHGPKVRHGTHAQKVYLHAIIDDATRYVVAARFHLAEDTRAMLDDLMLSIRRFGIPLRLYTDNGAAFRSRHLGLVAAKLGIALPHTPAYRPQGRGKIERFFRSVREGFLTGRDKTTLEKLNTEFTHWLNSYHQRPHRSLNCSPLERKLCDTGAPLKQIAPTHNIDELFRMETLKKVGSDGCVRLFGRRFEIPDAIPGSTIVVYYLPWSQDHILAGAHKLPLKPIDTLRNARRFEKPHRGTAAQNPQETQP